MCCHDVVGSVYNGLFLACAGMIHGGVCVHFGSPLVVWRFHPLACFVVADVAIIPQKNSFVKGF